MRKRVLIAVTHLLGAGHLTRATALAAAFAREGHETTLVSGGMPSSIAPRPNVSFVQLPPVKTQGTDFSTLLDANNQPVTTAFLQVRSAALVTALRRARPHILITELFPFGRRGLADEFKALLREAHRMRPRPLILSSIRDILVAPAKPGRIAETGERLGEFYDAVLVHGDPTLAPLDLSWPVDERLRPMLRYTGYVDEAAPMVDVAQRAGIVVSGGSSAASLPLYRAALEASRIVSGTSWRVLVGRGIDDDTVHALRHDAPPHVSVERARPDFRQLLAGAELSVSQAGYNTCVDLLRAGVRAVLVPFEAGRETEQRLRAECLRRSGRAQILPEDALDGPSLAEAVTALLRKPAPPPASVALDGARESVRIAEELSLSRPALLRAGVDWTLLDTALQGARDRDREPVLWWRDDDAAEATPQLDRLLGLADAFDAGLGIAAVPSRVQTSLVERLREEPRASILVHGYAHANHAPQSDKKAEFGPAREVAVMEGEAREGLRHLEAVFGDSVLRVFVPPWNRISPALVRRLPEAGYVGLSTFRDRPSAHPAPGLLQVNTHVDPIDWHGTRSLAQVPALVAALADAVRSRAVQRGPMEPVGLLTHHLVHDEAIWSFCEELLVFLAQKKLRFALVRKLFCDKIGNVVEL